MKQSSIIAIKIYLSIIVLIALTPKVVAKNIKPIEFSGEDIKIGKSVLLLKDSTEQLEIKDVLLSDKFKKSDQKVPTFWFTSSAIWVKFELKNNTPKNNLLLYISAPLIDEVELFHFKKNGHHESVKIGQNTDFFKRKYRQPGYIFDLNIKPKSTQLFFLKIISHDQIQIPLQITTTTNFFTSYTTYNFVFGIYCGIMIIMILYNLFVYFTIRDKSYLYYVLYILAVTLTQTTFQGYTFKYLWPSSPKFETQSILLMSVFVGITSIEFLRNFINTKKYLPKWDRLFYIAHVAYAIITVLTLSGMYRTSWILILSVVSPLSMYMLLVAYKIAYTGSRPAKFFAVSWTIFLVGVFIYAMKDFGILPYNNFTVYTMPVGSAIETVLLSFALADKINILKKEKEESQQKTLEVLQENEKIVRTQNITLEKKVNERTAELNRTLGDLKQAQSKLVDAEKMSSLGQLTAGIAHEINNPINFVSSNITPLRQDIDDLKKLIKGYEDLATTDNLEEKLDHIEELKKELDYDYLQTELDSIINGIEDGAKRTTEIVSGLRNFSRLDEGELKMANINDGIESTLILIKNKLNGIKVEKELGDIPSIECYPGKLNQLFMNIVDNAIDAIQEKNTDQQGEIHINTYVDKDSLIIRVKDNGIGFNQTIKDKMFEPFFTTKEVGEGTGLGLSIVYSIIEAHNGEIQVESKENEGTEMIIKLPIKQ